LNSDFGLGLDQFWADFCADFNIFKKKYFFVLLSFGMKLTNLKIKLQIQNTKAQTNNHKTKSKSNFTNPNNQIQNPKITNPNNHIGIYSKFQNQTNQNNQIL
jgi:hypothetical protein